MGNNGETGSFCCLSGIDVGVFSGVEVLVAVLVGVWVAVAAPTLSVFVLVKVDLGVLA